MKKIKWACILQEIEFDSERELEVYLSNIRGIYIVSEKLMLPGGRVKIVIKKNYNKCKMEENENA